MKKISLTRGYEALIDDEDYELVALWATRGTWTAAVRTDTVYAYWQGWDSDTQRVLGVLLHRLLLGVPPGVHVDHKDGNGLNNQRANLRRCTMSQNLGNQRRSRANTSGIKGVSWDKSRQKWKAQIKINQHNTCLGRFAQIEDAAAAYEAAARRLFGEFARIE